MSNTPDLLTSGHALGRRELVQRLMQMKLAEAEHLNEANAIYQDVVRALRASVVKCQARPNAHRGGHGRDSCRPGVVAREVVNVGCKLLGFMLRSTVRSRRL